jgi:hypothetical protein
VVYYQRRYPGPVRVLLVDGYRHVLDHASDPRVVSGADGPPDLVMLPSGRFGALHVPTPALAPEVLERLRSGAARLVLDSSGEGPVFSPKLAEAAHALMRDLGVPAANAVYLTQNRAFRAAYRDWCGGETAPFEVINYDYYWSRFFHLHLNDGAATYADRLAAFEARAAERERRFVCLNFSPRTSKVLLLLAMVRDGLWDHGFFSFPGFDKQAHDRAVSKKGMLHDLLIQPGLEAEGAALAPWLDALGDKGPAMLGVDLKPRHIKALSNDMALEEYNRSWFTVITETEAANTRRVTEKPLKPMANFSPVILWGNAGALALLRGFDFKTFGGLVDEAYDDEPDHARRFEMVLGEIRRLCALPQAALREAEQALAETLAHNADRALVQMPRIYRDRYEPELIDRLVAPTRARAPA